MRRRLMQSGLGLSLFLGLAFALGCSSTSTPESSYTSPVSKAQMAVNGASISSAMQKATSWHVTMKGPNVDMTMDVVCPDKMRTVSKTGSRSAETVRVGPAMYMKAGGKWMKVPATGQPASVCGNTAAPGSKMPTVDPNVTMTKGGTETVNGESCTDWTTTASDGKGGQTSSTMCIGSDNLPRQIKTGQMVMTYSDWNKPITIDAPKL
ncbi:MAG: DUF4412 domain-containing protein [Acidobacteriota bacterium]|nr:DUF4412 domain-containing protein [Acidobacteriota bacterium]